MALALPCVDLVHSSHSLALGTLYVGDGITDHILQLQEYLQHPMGLLVDEAGDALHAATLSQEADVWLSDILDVVLEHLPVALGATISPTCYCPCLDQTR